MTIINFLFKKEDKKTFSKDLPFNTTIKDIKLMIAEECDINEDVSIMLKSKNKDIYMI